MMERCQDGMMYVRRYGNATFFITMKCNLNWPEIKMNLFLNQQPNDGPDLIARVFDVKRKNKVLDWYPRSVWQMYCFCFQCRVSEARSLFIMDG